MFKWYFSVEMSNYDIGWSSKRALGTDIFFLKNKLIIIFIHQCQKLLFVMFRCVQIFDSFLLAIMMHQTYPCHLKSLIMLEHFRLFIWTGKLLGYKDISDSQWVFFVKFIELWFKNTAIKWTNQPKMAWKLLTLVIEYE